MVKDPRLMHEAVPVQYDKQTNGKASRSSPVSPPRPERKPQLQPSPEGGSEKGEPEKRLLSSESRVTLR